MKVIQTYELTKYYGKNRGIVDLELSVEQGDFYGFIGPNGAGKSTTIRILLGLITATRGRAEIFGKDIGRAKTEILSGIGYLPSETMFYRGMRVRDVLRLSADLRGKNCGEESRELCERLELDPSRRVEELSLGNRKKVGIVCAMQHRPGLYLMDEPTSGLDPLMQKEFFSLLKERSQEGATVFLSSHVLSEVQRYCTHAAVIRDGRLLACDSVERLGHTDTKRVTVRGIRSLLKPELVKDVRAAGDAAGFSETEQVRDVHAFRDAAGFLGLEQVRDVCVSEDTVSFLYGGKPGQLLQALAKLPVTDLTITEPDLEEVFMHYYEEGGVR